MARDFEKGLKTRRKVLGNEWVDRALKTMTPFNEEFQDLITRYAWNEIWNRPGIKREVRRMIVIAQMVALGRWEEYRLHLRASLASGDLSTDDVKEILLQSAIYCGVPAANTAFKEAREVIEALEPSGKKAAKQRRHAKQRKEKTRR
jgi:4-carboxymuconolactone decarboxylase